MVHIEFPDSRWDNKKKKKMKWQKKFAKLRDSCENGIVSHNDTEPPSLPPIWIERNKRAFFVWFKKKKIWTWLAAKQINSICSKFWNDKIWKSSFRNKLHDVGIEEKQRKRENWAKMRRFVFLFLEWIYKLNICMHLFNGVTRCSSILFFMFPFCSR